MKSSLSFMLVLLTIACATATKDCYISGLAEKSNQDASVTILSVDNVTSLSLSCRCSLHSPKWEIEYLKDSKTEVVEGPIGCVDNSGDCTPKETNYLGMRRDGVFTFINHTFSINQTSVLKCYKYNGLSESPDETAVIYFRQVEEEPEVPTTTITELPTTTVSTKLPSLATASTSSYPPGTLATITERISTVASDTMQRPSIYTSSPSPSMASEMTFIDTIEEELGQSALYLLPIALALLVVVVVLLGCLLVVKYRRNKVPKDVENLATPQKQSPDMAEEGSQLSPQLLKPRKSEPNPYETLPKQSPDMAEEESQLSPQLLESRAKSKPNNYITLIKLSPSMHHISLESVPKSCDNMTNLLRVGAEGSSTVELSTSEVALTAPVSLHTQRDSLRLSNACTSAESQTITSKSTAL